MRFTPLASGGDGKMAASGEGSSQVIFPAEAESFAQSLKTFSIEDIGGTAWSRQHEALEKLNMQAVMNAMQQTDEFVKEYLVSYEKVPILVYDLITTELWKEKVFPLLLKSVHKPKTTFPCYVVLHHEATLVNIFETTLYYQEVCESADESALDLVDYCHRKTVALIARQQLLAAGGREGKSDGPDDSCDTEDESTRAAVEELQRQREDLEFSISVKCVAVIRYLIDQVANLPLSVSTRILNKHDFPSLFVSLIEDPPWTRLTDKGETEKYSEGSWKVVPHEDRLQLTKLEAQAWLAVYQLLLNPECQRKYQFNMSNKNRLLKLRAFLVEPYIDQIPHLGDLRRYLEHLSLSDPPMAQGGFVLEQVPEMYERILRENKGKWERIAHNQCPLLFHPAEGALKEQAKRWVDTYNLDLLEGLLTEPPKCAMCGQLATKRCSRCRNEWYCTRECQVKHWKNHKPICDVMVVTGKTL